MKTGTINTFIHQKINSYLCIALLAVMAFWTVLYYGTHKAAAIADTYASSYNTANAAAGNFGN